MTDAALYPEFECLDCEVNTADTNEYYMVHDYLWREAGMDAEGGMLCINCLETRLGFSVNPFHFTGAPVNHVFFSYHGKRFDEEHE